MPRFPSDTGVSIPLASEARDGIMASTDKVKLDALQVGGGGQNVIAKITIQRSNGLIPDADIVLFADNCSKVDLPATSTCTRQYILFHNMTKRTVIISAYERDEIFGYFAGVGVGYNESIHVVHEPNSTRWRVL